MQELMVGTNRLPPRRVTALGGGVIGLCIGLAISVVVGAFLLDQQRAAATLSVATTRATLEGTIAAMREENNARNRSYSCAPLLYAVKLGETNALQIRKFMDQFPAFKTDPYKQLFADLGGVVDQQRQQSGALLQALSASALEGSVRCKIAETPATEGPLWTFESVSLSKDGWRGITP